MNTSTHFNKIVITFLFLPLSVLSFGQQDFHKDPVEKVLVKSFNLEDNQVVSLDLGEMTSVQKWSKNTVRIQMNISLENGTNTILKSLVQAGKYNLKSSVKDGVFSIFGTGLGKQIEVGGTLLLENISFTVFVPENVLVQLPKGIN